MEEKPVEKPVEEESDSSYYSYSYSDDERPAVVSKRADPSAPEENIFSSLLKSSRKLLDENRCTTRFMPGSRWRRWTTT